MFELNVGSTPNMAAFFVWPWHPSAIDMLEKDNLTPALGKMKQAIEDLEAAEAADPTLDLTEAKRLLALTAKCAAVDAIERAQSPNLKPNEQRKIEAATLLVADGDVLRDAGDYIGAVGKYLEAVRQVQGML